MKKHSLMVLLVLCELVLLEGKLQASDPNAVGLDAMKSITPERLRAQLTLIASDEFEGRETSFRGQKLAARYIASQFELMGLQPAGDSGTYFQHFPVVHITVDTTSFLTTSTPAGTKEWREFGKEYIPFYSGRDTSISGDVEFVGYGINSRILSYTDYDSTKNYAGKIVLVLHGTPREEDSTSVFAENRSAGSAFAKRIYAQRCGAAAVLIVEDLRGRTMKEAFSERQDDLVRGLITIPQRARNNVPMFSVSTHIANELLRSSGKTVDGL